LNEPLYFGLAPATAFPSRGSARLIELVVLGGLKEPRFYLPQRRHQREGMMSENEETPLAEETKAAAPIQQQQTVQVDVDDSHVSAAYANFCRVTGSPEELIIDFGLNPQPVGMPKNAIPVTQRVIVNYFTAKRLLHALSLSVQRHESVFGVLETDIQKRLKPGLQR
jgi:hypothetical protein